MKKLVAFGCSHTYGESLPDCITPQILDKPMPPPSKFAWPTVLSCELNLNCSNQADCGISNRQISYHILNADLDANDLVVILWTGLYRTCILGKNGIDKLHPSYARPHYKSLTDQYSKNRYKFNYNYYRQFYSEDNLIHESLQCIDHTKKYLDSRNIINYHFTFKRTVGHDPIESTWPKNLPGWFAVKENIVELIDNYGDDDHHPGVQAQKYISKQMLSIIDC